MHHIDELSTDFIRGWTFDDKNPTKEIELDIFFEKKYLKTIKSNLYREDLQKAFGNGNHSFKFRIPEQYKNKKADFRIIRKDNQELILQGNLDMPKISKYNDDLIRYFGNFLNEGFWRPSKLFFDKNLNILLLEGFSCAPKNYDDNVCFIISDGKEKFLCDATFSENPTGVKTYFDILSEFSKEKRDQYNNALKNYRKTKPLSRKSMEAGLKLISNFLPHTTTDKILVFYLNKIRRTR